MKNNFLLLFLLFCAAFNAQEIIMKTDSATGGKLTINAEEKILKLIDEKAICKEISANNKTKTSTKPKPTNTCQGQTHIMGYMIKVGDAKSEQEINTMMGKFKSEFPELRVEKDFFRPDFRLRAGDYLTKETAQTDLRKIRKNFPTAVITSWRIYCNRAK